MRIDFYGLQFETPCLTFYLWSPWRAAALEHKLFDAVKVLPGVKAEADSDELRVHVSEPKVARQAVQAAARVLKGWQEDAAMTGDRRTWRWLLEGDTNSHGYDHHGEPVSIWGFLRVSVERGGPGDSEKGEDVDLEGFGLRIWGATEK